jgi:translation initiation factor eIF-2B subunit delta
MSDWQVAVVEIRNDNRSGATALLRRAASALELAVDAHPEAGTTGPGELARAARAVATVRPAMGALCRLAGVALAAAEGAPPAEAAPRSIAAIRRFMRRVEREASAIADRAAGLLGPGDLVVTISASSLVERAVLAAAAEGRAPRVVCLESCPAREGAALAARLAAADLPVTLVSDAAGASAVGRARLVLLGGDTLSPAGLVHKVGTLGLALAARHGGALVYALCGREKWLPAPLRGALGDGGPPEEILSGRPSRLAVANPYFDRTPLELVDGVVDSRSILPAAVAARLARRIRVHPALRDLLDSSAGESLAQS